MKNNEIQPFKIKHNPDFTVNHTELDIFTDSDFTRDVYHHVRITASEIWPGTVLSYLMWQRQLKIKLAER